MQLISISQDLILSPSKKEEGKKSPRAKSDMHEDLSESDGEQGA